jgi:signal transduction histidine kinase
MLEPGATEPGRRLREAALAAVVAYGIAAVVVPRSAPTPPGPTTYGEVSAAARIADLAAGLGLLAAGVFAASEPQRRRLGVLAILAGVTWFGPDWEGWYHGPALVVSLGAAAPVVFLALVVHLVLSFPSGRLGSRLGVGMVCAAYAVAAVAALARALFRDPLLDLYCWRNCIDNSFLVRSDGGLTRAVGDLWPPALTALGLALAVVAGARLLVASEPARHRLWQGLVPGGLVGAAAAAYGVALWHQRLETPRSSTFFSLFLVLACSAAALGVGVGWDVARTRRTRASLGRLAQELGEAPRPGGLQDALAAALGDPTLVVLYWLPGSQRFVDHRGREARPPATGDDRAATPITRRGETIAVVVHDAALLDVPDLEREIGSAARLAVENERLQAEVLAQLEAVRSSRARIVELGDRERRRLERNLHDGAQQGLLALSYQLRLACAAVEEGGDAELSALLASSAAKAQSALDELRHLAHGIYPAILGEAGLEPALADLADTAVVPVEITAAPSARYPAAVETAAYIAVAEAIDDAVARDATFVGIAVREEGDRLVLVADDDGAPRRSPPVHVCDRVGALAGVVDARETTLRAEIPCV